MTEWRFQRDAVRCFRFVRADFDAASGEAALVYAFDDGPELIERIAVPGAPFELDAARAAAVQRALHLLHLIAGVSYYKAAVPPEILIESYAIDAETAALLAAVYENGLGEFAHRNGLSLRGKIRFPAIPGPYLECSSRREDVPGEVCPSPQPAPRPSLARGRSEPSEPMARELGSSPRGERGLQAHALVAIGGGKDSLVSIEALRAMGVAQTLFWIGGSSLIAACAARTGLAALNIGRRLAPELFAFNREGAWNGHIPVTAINSAIGVLVALLHGFDQVVFSNERSASYGSLIPGTGEVNHQWSKGWDFERDFGALVERCIAPGLHYYSLLRPLSELAVARQFARSERYDAVFSSCNRNFHIQGERPASRWCGQCPKCHFVFLALAPFLPKPRLTAIFGRNLLDEPAQAAGFDALLEYREHKPFECVGEAIESRAALADLARRPAWREDALVARFAREILPQLEASQPAIESLLNAQGEHRIPSGLWERWREHFGA
jgi:UDP-N-acetyl-alpha-D-muramoyl-L-alanyl-L-glutamate epimerase